MNFKKIKIFLLLFLIILPKVIAPTLNKFTKPDFGKHPYLVIHNSYEKVYDFKNESKVTYYYNTIGREILFSIGEHKLSLGLIDIGYDKENKEYATIKMSARKLSPAYESLYQKRPLKLKLFGEEIIIIAESIIDHDNIEYLTIKGIDESEEIIQAKEEKLPEEASIIKDTNKKEELIEEKPVPKKEVQKTVESPSNVIYLIIILKLFVLLFILSISIKKDKNR